MLLVVTVPDRRLLGAAGRPANGSFRTGGGGPLVGVGVDVLVAVAVIMEGVVVLVGVGVLVSGGSCAASSSVMVTTAWPSAMVAFWACDRFTQNCSCGTVPLPAAAASLRPESGSGRTG